MAMGSPSKQRPLMLKDYLREDQSFDPRGGFPPAARGEATVRRLLDLELGGGRLARGRPKGATLTRISAFFHAFRSLAAPPKGALQRSLSRRLLPRALLRRRACSRREESGRLEDAKNRVSAGRFLIMDVLRLESFTDETRGGIRPAPLSPPRPSSPAGSCSCSTSGWSEVESSSSAEPSTPPDRSKRPHSSSPKEDVVGEEDAACRDYEEKEQLSPVSVMDFPYEEEEEAAEASPSFQRSLASIERTTAELLKKIRRFESLARLVDPADLAGAGAFEEAPAGGEEPGGGDDEALAGARKLLGEVTWRCSEEPLLLEFFSQGLRGCATGDAAAGERLLRAAREWEDGVVPKDVASREALVAEMDASGRWARRSEAADEGVAGDLEAEVLASLLEDLAEELLLLD